MVNNSWFKRLLYKIYKMQWCEEHHCNLEDVDEEIGVNGECYVSYDEFVDNELENEEIVKSLIEWFTTLNENEKGCSLCLQKTSGSSSTHIFNLNNSEFCINKVKIGVWHKLLMINVTTTLGIDIPIALEINYCPYCGKKLTYDGGDKTYDDFLSLIPKDCYVPKKVSVRGCSFCKISGTQSFDTICFSGFNRAYEFPVTSIEIQLYEGHIDIAIKKDDEKLLLRESVNYCPFCGIALEDEVENSPMISDKDIEHLESIYNIKVEVPRNIIPLSEVTAYIEQILSENSDKVITGVCFDVDVLSRMIDISFYFYDTDNIKRYNHHCFVNLDELEMK